MSRNYKERAIDDAIKKVQSISREEALKLQIKKETERTVFVLTYNPALPSVSSSRGI